MTVQLRAAAAEPGTGRQRLGRLVREHLGFIADHGPTYRLLFAELGRAASLVEIAAGVDLAILAPTRQVLRDGQRDGTLQVDDIGAAASAVYGTVLVAGMQQLLVGPGRDIDDHALVDVMLHGLAAPRRAAR